MVINRKAVIVLLILLLSFSAFAVQAQDDVPEGDPIAYGDTITDELTSDAPEAYFTFEGRAGDAVDISLSADFDTYMFLFDSNGLEIETDDDSGEGLNSRMIAFELPADGSYTIRATSFSYRNQDNDDPRTGDYTLSLNIINMITVEMNSTISATFDDETQTLYFAFEGAEGDVVDFIVNSGNALDTRMVVLTPFGYEQASSDDAPGSVDPALFEERLNGDGTYIVIIEAQNPNATLNGEITVTIGMAELASLNDGAIAVSLDSDDDTQIMIFDASRGEIIRVVVDVVSRSDFASPNIELIQNEESIATVSGTRGVDYLVFDVLITFDGPVTLSVQSYSDYEAEISIIRDPEADADSE